MEGHPHQDSTKQVSNRPTVPTICPRLRTEVEAVGRGDRSMQQRHWWLVLAGLVGAAEVVVGARIALRGAQPVIGTGATARIGTTTGGGVMIAGAGLLLLVGIVCRRRSRPGGGILIAAGAVPAMLLWPWTMPLAVVLAVPLELVRTRYPGRPGTPPLSGYQVALALGVQVATQPLAYLILIGRLPLAAGLPLLGLLLVYIRLRRRGQAA